MEQKKRSVKKERKRRKPERYIHLHEERKQVPEIPGDEYFCNGIFLFHITGLNDYINSHPDEFTRIEIDVNRYERSIERRSALRDEYVDQADLARPVLLIEIAPDTYELGNTFIDRRDYSARGYNIGDGSHRIEKAIRTGRTTLPAYLVRMEQHIHFLCEGYPQYVEYWNTKLMDATEYLARRKA